MKYSKLLSFIGFSLTLIGMLGIFLCTFFWYQNRRITEAAVSNANSQVAVVAQQEKEDKEVEQIHSGFPVQIEISSLNIKLPVAEGFYNTKNGKWTLSTNKAHFATVTVLPNDKQGNTFIYGHYRREVFSKLHKIQPGAIIQITTDNGYKFTYKYINNVVVSPNDTAFLKYQGPPKLTVQTCTGRFMQNRQLFSFDFISVEKI